MLTLQFTLGSIAIVTILSLPIYKHEISFNLFRPPKIFHNFQCVSLKYFILVDAVLSGYAYFCTLLFFSLAIYLEIISYR